MQQQLRRRLSSLEGELGAAVSELGGLRHALREKEERGVREERERERNRAMVAASQEAIDRLAAELDQTRRHHARLEEQTERHWRETVEEMRRDADRMKVRPLALKHSPVWAAQPPALLDEATPPS